MQHYTALYSTIERCTALYHTLYHYIGLYIATQRYTALYSVVERLQHYKAFSIDSPPLSAKKYRFESIWTQNSVKMLLIAHTIFPDYKNGYNLKIGQALLVLHRKL